MGFEKIAEELSKYWINVNEWLPNKSGHYLVSSIGQPEIVRFDIDNVISKWNRMREGNYIPLTVKFCMPLPSQP